MPAQRGALVALIRGIVLSQGNVFIKELLRDRGIKIGTNKTEFEKNLIAAIETGELERAHVESWLNEVEGWGNQHVYIFRVPSHIRAKLVDAAQVARLVTKAGLHAQWNANISLEFPPERTLTRITFEHRQLSFVWHQGREFAIRAKDRDYREEELSDVYEYRAYRIRSERSVTRFVVRSTRGLAALFLQLAWDENEHEAVIADIRRIVDRVLPFDEFEQLAIASAIKKLDTQSLLSQNVVARSTRLSSAGAYVEFASTSAQFGYQDVGPVREVRRAVQPRDFVGLNGNFVLPCSDRDGESRAVRVQLFGEQKRLKLAHQMTASEVWSVIDLVKANV